MNLKNNFVPALIGSLLITLVFTVVILIVVVKHHKEYLSSHVLVSQSFLDSLKYVASLPPVITVKDSIIHDTIWIERHHNPIPTPDPVDSTLNVYRDSLQIKDTVDVSIRFKTTGTLQGSIDWLYKPIYRERIITIEKKVPYPVERQVFVDKYHTGTYLSIASGGGVDKFLIGGDLDIVTKNDYIYGLQYRRFGKDDIYGVKFGIRLRLR